MATKGVPFRYLEFSRAIGWKSSPHARARRRPPGLAPEPELGPGFGFGRGSNMGAIDPFRYPNPRCNGWKKPLQRFLSGTVTTI